MLKQTKESIAKRASGVSLRTLGVIGIFEEAILQKGERPTLLIIFASMLGLPTFLSVDKKLKDTPNLPPTAASPAVETTVKNE
jgi:hypothetical protein